MLLFFAFFINFELGAAGIGGFFTFLLFKFNSTLVLETTPSEGVNHPHVEIFRFFYISERGVVGVGCFLCFSHSIFNSTLGLGVVCGEPPPCLYFPRFLQF